MPSERAHNVGHGVSGTWRGLTRAAERTYTVCMIEFDRDPQKARANLEKHGISFEEAKSVLFDDYAPQFFDEEHS